MEALISDNLLLCQSLVSLSYRFPSTKNARFSLPPRRRCSWKPKLTAVSSSTSASPDPGVSIYGGWEELEILEEAGKSNTIEPFRSFINSLGIDDRKQVLSFLLGFFAALSVSRVRISTIAILPVSILVFVGGFTTAVVQSASAVKKLGINGGAFGVFDEKLKDLEALFCDVDGKMEYLRNGIEKGINSGELGVEVTESYLQIVEHVRGAIWQAQKTLTDSLSNELANGHMDSDSVAKKMNQKSSRKRIELGESGIDVFRFLTGMLHESLIGSKARKSKDTSKEKLAQQLNTVDVNDPPFVVSDRGMVTGNVIGERSRSPLDSFNQVNYKVDESGMPSDDKQKRMGRKLSDKEKSGYNVWNNGDSMTDDACVMDGAKYDFKKEGLGSGVHSFGEELDNQRSSIHFMTSHGSFQKIVLEQNYERGAFNNHFHDSTCGDTSQKRTRNIENLTSESKPSSLHEHNLEIQNRTYDPSCGSESNELIDKQLNGFNFEKDIAALEYHSNIGKQGPVHADCEGKMPYSSNISVDEQFEQSMKEAIYLSKCARKYMLTQADEEKADAMLYKAAELLSAAVVLRPMSLIAVGQLGNTYLLHGELKLKVSRELRTLLLRSSGLVSGMPDSLRFKRFDSIVTSREDIASVLVSVCEECEGLLVEAGRKYRRALSIDVNDLRALYNWGLALCFRAQLMADAGPEAAMDADKIYLAAIDKFNAMISRSNAYAPDALCRWGMALQQRSQLRPKNSREKSKLLHQAKSLFEDVLTMESENQLARDALVSCISQLHYNSQFRASRSR